MEMAKVLRKHPFATIYELVEALKKPFNGREFDKDFVHRIKREIRQERIEELRKSSPEEDLLDYVMALEYVCIALQQIIDNGGMKHSKAIVSASKVYTDLREKVIELKMNLGIHERQLGKLDLNVDIDPELKASIDEAFTNFKIKIPTYAEVRKYKKARKPTKPRKLG